MFRSAPQQASGAFHPAFSFNQHLLVFLYLPFLAVSARGIACFSLFRGEKLTLTAIAAASTCRWVKRVNKITRQRLLPQLGDLLLARLSRRCKSKT
ncbi:MAG: hypothetical protein KME32_23835 [Mojavia pulchra JT2-VF2]|jgi:hypothetical protein|uniref:Uncharacterized protein n=1 Tax=Mojavia pulchra JT2-VF2 TaxID=287848 RepID=A0A951Q1P1_9NOST|nr:hypothetical protein [Mojavia pulchra JT2-VF2]